MDKLGKICIWPCGTFCDLDQLEEHLMFMSDDYKVVDLSLNDSEIMKLITESCTGGYSLMSQ